jgi:hypothetical protein
MCGTTNPTRHLIAGIVVGVQKAILRFNLAALKDGLYKGIDERSSADYFASGWRYGKRAGAGRGCWLSVGFLVSGGAESRDSGEQAGYGYVVGGAAGFGADCGGAGFCYAGFLSAPGDTAFLWAF